MENKIDLMENYLDRKGLDSTGKRKFCCLNPDHDDSHPSMSYNKANGTVHCFSCNATYDIYDIMGIEHKLVNFQEKRDKAMQLYGTGTMSNIKPAAYQNGYKENKKETEKQSKQDFGSYIENCHNEIAGRKIAMEYLAARGITKNSVVRYKLGYDKTTQSIVFPYSQEGDYYCTRKVTEKIFRKPKDSIEPIFNYKVLQKGMSCFIVTEAILCAISISQYCDIPAVSLCGIGYIRLLALLKEKNMRDTLVLICFDKDKTGDETTKEFIKGLEKEGISYMDVRADNSYKDPNEHLMADENSFKLWCTELMTLAQNYQEQKKKPNLMQNTLKSLLKNEKIHESDDSQYITGFEELDKNIKLKDDLVVLGGIPSSGKSTLAFQIAQQMSYRYHILYFSLEQSQEELISQILDREQYKTKSSRKEAAQNILNNIMNLSIIELSGKGSFEKIKQISEDYAKNNNVKPVLFIDYLQLLQGDSLGTSTKDRIDRIVSELKELSRENHWLIFVISSLNRTNYLQLVDFDSFKETGGIEYSASVLLGLEYRILHSRDFQDDKNTQNKRELLNKERRSKIRNMEIICIKNRRGPVGFVNPFRYLPESSLFVEYKEKSEKRR